MKGGREGGEGGEGREREGGRGIICYLCLCSHPLTPPLSLPPSPARSSLRPYVTTAPTSPTTPWTDSSGHMVRGGGAGYTHSGCGLSHVTLHVTYISTGHTCHELFNLRVGKYGRLPDLVVWPGQSCLILIIAHHPTPALFCLNREP